MCEKGGKIEKQGSNKGEKKNKGDQSKKEEMKNTGDQNKKEEKKNKGDQNKKEEKKKDVDGSGLNTVIMTIYIHCEGCALKIKKSVKKIEGVEAVSTDMANNKLTVIGRVDPVKIRERVESKTRKKVDLISPVNAPKKPQVEPKEQNKPEDKKPKEPTASTVVLKITLHCEGCTRKIRRTALRVKGVENVNINSQKDLVTVKGTMDANNLATFLRDKLKRSVEIVPQKKEGGVNGEKKEKDGGKGGEKKGNNADEKKNENENGELKKKTTTTTMSVEANKMECHVPYGGYRIEMVHAPQLFSDENPNACSIM